MSKDVLQFLGNKAPTSKNKETEKGKAPRRPEDRYDLDDICKAAI